jgi:hypothetical protein
MAGLALVLLRAGDGDGAAEFVAKIKSRKVSQSVLPLARHFRLLFRHFSLYSRAHH